MAALGLKGSGYSEYALSRAGVPAQSQTDINLMQDMAQKCLRVIGSGLLGSPDTILALFSDNARKTGFS